MSYLTARELQVARLIADGYTYLEIAEKLGISIWTVRTYADIIRNKLDVDNRRQIAKRMRELKLLE